VTAPGGAESGKAPMRLFRAGLLGSVAAGFMLWAWGPVPWGDAVYLAVLLVLLPVLALVQLLVIDEHDLERLPVYVASGISILVLGLLALWAGRSEPGWTAMGLGGYPLGRALGQGGILTALVLAILFVERWIRERMGIGVSRLLRELLPRTRPEKRVFFGLSFIAGTCEELAYRGFAMMWLLALTGSAVAALLLSSAAFGLLHAYQGVSGIFRTSLLGVVLGTSLLVWGSLWPAMIAHTALDLLAGLVLADHLLGPERLGD
jgi:membrane protease YdiL (CAAX protease family)